MLSPLFFFLFLFLSRCPTSMAQHVLDLMIQYLFIARIIARRGEYFHRARARARAGSAASSPSCYLHKSLTHKPITSPLITAERAVPCARLSTRRCSLFFHLRQDLTDRSIDRVRAVEIFACGRFEGKRLRGRNARFAIHRGGGCANVCGNPHTLMK